MRNFRRTGLSLLAAAVFVATPIMLNGQVAGLQQKLEAEYALSKATADRSDIVTAGAVLVLEKDNLLMYTSTTSAPPTNTYKDGKISQGVFGMATCKWCRKIPGTGSVPAVDTRTFVAGEKFWVTKIDVRDDSIVFEFFSDPISDVRYYGLLKFPFSKNSPSPDQLMSTIAEVIKVQPADNSSGDAGQQQAAAPAAPAQPAPAPQQAMAPIAAPPPPSDAPPAAPKTIALGQTKDQVVAIIGQPTKVVKLPTKEIDYYPDMKVIFVEGKVKDVQ